jgi:hypothetical protein
MKQAVRTLLDARLAYSSALKKKAIYSSEKSFDFHPTTCRYIPEAETLHSKVKKKKSKVKLSL